MEIVLALGLTTVVMYLLMTGVELFMVRMDTSRGRVESSQVARTILDQMADDIAALRIDPPAAARGGGQGMQSGASQQGGGASGANSFGVATGGQSGGGAMSQFSAGGAGGSATSEEGSGIITTHGIFGNVEELRIDRAAPPNWVRASREVDPTEPAATADFPRTVRYYLVDGTAQTSQEAAKQGVTVEEGSTPTNVAGLYRELIPTASLSDDADPLTSPVNRDGARTELLAQEVVKLEFHYFDGEQLVDEWDVVEEGALPQGVEILLTIHEPDYGPQNNAAPQSAQTGQNYREKDLVVYRRFVRISAANPPPAAEMLLPQSQNGGAQQVQGNGAGAGGNGGGGNNSTGGGNNGGNSNNNGGGAPAGGANGF